jgi:hypothetical protein
MPIFAISRSQNRFLKNSKSTLTTTVIIIKAKSTGIDIFCHFNSPVQIHHITAMVSIQNRRSHETRVGCPTVCVSGKGGVLQTKPPDAESAVGSRFPESAGKASHLSGARGIGRRFIHKLVHIANCRSFTTEPSMDRSNVIFIFFAKLGC